MVARNVEWYEFQGKGSWFLNLFHADIPYNCWSVRLHFNPPSYDLFMKLKEVDENGVEGILNEVKKDDDGYYHTFRRPIQKEWRDRNGVTQTIHFDPPIVLDANGQPWDRKVDIGNGSDITVKVECYKFNVPRKKGVKGRAIRLVSVGIDNLVEYSRKDFSPAQEKAVQGLDQRPKQLF